VDSQRQGRLGRLVLFFLVLNLLLAAAGAGLEYWRAQPRALPSFNAEKVTLRGIGEADLGDRKANDHASKASAAGYFPPDP